MLWTWRRGGREIEQRLSELEDENTRQAASIARLEAAVAALTPRREPDADGPDPSPVIHTRAMGNLANRMIQHMASLALQARIPGSRLSNVRLPEWGVVHEEIALTEPVLRWPGENVGIERTAARVLSGEFRDVSLAGYLQNVGNLLPPDEYRGHYRNGPPPFLRVAADEILVSLRMREVLTGFYPFYTLLPVGFYRGIVARTGLRPVFFGQLTPCGYLDALRSAFPDARFVDGRGAMEDFAVLRAARHLCLSVSTFSWVAAYIGEAERIVLPMHGLLSPASCASFGTDLDLVPRDDPRYDHVLFPVDYAVPAERVLDHHATLEGRWRHVPADEIRSILDGSFCAPRRIADYEALFDPDYYARTHREVGQAVADGRYGQAGHHYALHGFEENRACFALDPAFYASSYPEAADAVAGGRFLDLHHFHAATGRARGYRTTPRSLGIAA